MNKKLLSVFVLLIFLLTFSFSETIHCWYVEQMSSSANVDFNGCAVPVNFDLNGINYKTFVTPGTKLIANNFGTFNFRCDNGVGRTTGIYAILSTAGERLTNTTNNGPSLARSEQYCTFTNGIPTGKGFNIGYGNLNSIEYLIGANKLGGQSYSLNIVPTPIATTYGDGENITKTSNYYVGTPSLMVLAPTILTENFDSKQGNYNKEIFFTLVNKSPLTTLISTYQIICPEGVTCAIDQNYSNQNWEIKSNEVMIISGTITVNKNTLPTSFNVGLDLNYLIKEFRGNLACQQMFSKKSVPTTLKFGLLDKQDFQVKLNSDYEQNNCVGENGMIGQTGPKYAPRVNLEFGGGIQNDAKIDIDECSSKDINGIDNNDWVYCSQKEFLVMLAERIGQIAKIREQLATKTNSAEIRALELETLRYANFSASIRTQNFSQEIVQSSISQVNATSNMLSSLGLSRYLPGANPTNQYMLLNNLYKNNGVNFGLSTAEAGTYDFEIQIKGPEYLSNNYLFTSDNNRNPSLNIFVKMSNMSPPQYPWFFYENGNSEITNSSVDASPTDGSNEATTNISKRGILFEFIQTSDNNFSTAKLYQSYALPLFVRIADRNGILDNNFQVTSTSGGEIFTYWTGFASSEGQGCSNISATGDTIAYYRNPDKKIFTSSASNYYSLIDFNSAKTNSKMYLETVLYLPISKSIQLITPFKVYLKNSVCDGNSSNNCTLNINSSSTGYAISNQNQTALKKIFDGIADENICVYKTRSSNNSEWTLFWNQQKILSDLNTMKRSSITDANICEARESLGG